MKIKLIIKRIAYSVSILNPGASALDRPEGMSLSIAIVIDLLLLGALLLLSIGLYTFYTN